MSGPHPQVLASDPAASVFVAANAGSGKTSTLVKRVARLLLNRAAPEAILCVTYTKAAAAEMQRRLFELLGDWVVTPDETLAKALADLGEAADDLPGARALFARALETPGGLKIQTIHAFCEQLLRRFPLEAGVSPNFRVLDDAQAAEVSGLARERLVQALEDAARAPLAQAYRRLAVELDWRSFEGLFATFEAKRGAIEAYVRACDPPGVAAVVWAGQGFAQPTAPEILEAEAVAGVDWPAWRRAAEALNAGSLASDQPLARRLEACGPHSAFAELWALFATAEGKPRERLATKAAGPAAGAWLKAEQGRLAAALERIRAARIARDTVDVLYLARAYAAFYEAAKAAGGALDFADLIEGALALLTRRADAAWVLYKLDGGVDHVLLDEAQDTAPEQWAILRALTEEFFAGAGAGGVRGRTVFAVGDQKQSIYSFQGADPQRLAIEAADYAGRVAGAGALFRETPLLESWRSTPQVLSFVDAVFADPALAAALSAAPPGAAPVILHEARREAGGRVDIWPLEESDPPDEVDPWAPVDMEPKEGANKKLARRVAQAVKAMLARGDRVFDKTSRSWRAAEAGDVLVLVRRRKALFHEIIRALKREGVPVGGADRLRLSEHVVFQDLVALGRFARFPEDDLTLAGLLRSPFCDIDEQGLFDLAHGRAGSLWAALAARARERPAWGEARALLDWTRAEAQARPPFDLYGRFLSRLDGAGRSMRARLVTRLGREAEDALEAFMGEVLSLEQGGIADLERALHALSLSDIEVKREQEDSSGRGGGEVRVMTAHGAKGLEAPIVILPDTTTRAGAQGGALLEDGDGGFIWAPRKAEDGPASSAARDRREREAAGESLRLLYVALTRARDRLIVCGVKTAPQYFKTSWYELVARAFEHPDIAAAARLVPDGDRSLLRFGEDPAPAPRAQRTPAANTGEPAWLRQAAPAEAAALRYASPTDLAEAQRGPAPSPLADLPGLGRFRRGELIHRLLQALPDLPAEERAAAARAILGREPDLDPGQAEEMARAALGVLENARFAAVFGPGSRAEAAIAGAAPGLPPGLAVSGRLDRVLVEPDRVLVVDFKTNRPAPGRIEDADPGYVLQMAVYAAVLAAVFPGRRVEAALVWTDGPKLMPIPEKMMAAALAGLTAAR